MNSINANNNEQEISFDLADLFSFLWQKKLRIIFSVSILVVTGYYFVSNLPKQYIATSTLLLSDQLSSVNIVGLGALAGQNASQMNTYMEIIRSRNFIRDVADKLNLKKEPEFYPNTSARIPSLEHTTEVIIEDLKLNHLNNTDMLKVSFVSKKPEVAAKVVNEIGAMFFELQLKEKRTKAETSMKWLNDQVSQLGEVLAESESKLQLFLEENGLVDLLSQLKLAQSEIATLMSEQIKNDRVVNNLHSIIEQIESQEGKNDSLLGIDKIASNASVRELVGRIINQKQVLSKISKRYKYKHYQHISASSQLQALQENLDEALKQSVNNLNREYKLELERQSTLVAKLYKAKLEHTKLGRLEVQLTRLERERESNQKLYEVFLGRLQENEIIKDIEQHGNFSVIDYAVIPTRPFKPNVALSVIVIFILSTLASVIFWLILHLVADKKTRFIGVLRNQNIALLGELPKPEKVKKSLEKDPLVRTRAPSKAEVEYSEAVRSLRSELMIRSDDTPIHTLLLTSVLQSKRRSKLAIELAESFSGLDKSILIDTDLRNPHIGIEFGFEQLTPGLTNFISRRCKFSDAIVREKGSQLSVMPSGPIPNDPLVYLTKPRFGGFIKRIGQLFERAVIETPAVNEFGDALVVSKFVDAVVLLCDLEKTEIGDLKDAIQNLQYAGAPLLGVVFENSRNIKSRSLKRNNNLVKKVINY